MNKKVLSEELKRYRQLLEYTFYVPENEKDVNGTLLTDDKYITEQDPAGDEDTEGDDPFMSLGGDETAPEAGAETAPEAGGETPETDPLADDAEVEDVDADETATETPTASTETGEESVEIDVTDIVDKTEATKSSVEGMSSKMDELLGKLSELENQVSGMDNVINKIDELEKQIEKRNPTPVERLEMRSMDSFPYSIKLTDFWKDKEGYEATEDEEEFVLKQSDVDNYNEKDIRKSFQFTKDEENN
jgi:hypothetical protein